MNSAPADAAAIAPAPGACGAIRPRTSAHRAVAAGYSLVLPSHPRPLRDRFGHQPMSAYSAPATGRRTAERASFSVPPSSPLPSKPSPDHQEAHDAESRERRQGSGGRPQILPCASEFLRESPGYPSLPRESRRGTTTVFDMVFLLPWHSAQVTKRTDAKVTCFSMGPHSCVHSRDVASQGGRPSPQGHDIGKSMHIAIPSHRLLLHDGLNPRRVMFHTSS